MDIRIGVTYSAKELDVELADGADTEQVKADVATALAGGGLLWLTDRKGRQVGVPAEKIAYVEIGSPDGDRKMGFGS